MTILNFLFYIITLFQNLPFASECELKPNPTLTQSVGMLSIPYTNQLYNSQIYQQPQTMMPLEIQQKPLFQLKYN